VLDVGRLRTRITVRMLGLTHAHDGKAVVHVLVHQDLAHLLDRFSLDAGALDILVQHVAVRRSRTVRASERHDRRRNSRRQIGPAVDDGDGRSRGRRHRVFQKLAGLITQHVHFGLGRDPVLEQYEKGVIERVSRFREIAQVEAP